MSRTSEDMGDAVADRLMMEAEEGEEGNEILKEWEEVVKDDAEGQIWHWAMTSCAATSGQTQFKEALRKIGKAKRNLKGGHESGHVHVTHLDRPIMCWASGTYRS